MNILFTFFHLGIVGFNLFGWIWKKTRKAHLIVVGLTVFSWIGLGFFYGFGYCFLTDWHWDVKRRLGERDLPASFIKYFADKFLNADFDAQMIDIITAGSFALVVLITIYVNFIQNRLNRS